MWPTAALATAVPEPPLPPLPLLPLLPPQAERPRAATAVRAAKALHRVFVIVRLRPFLRSSGALLLGWVDLAGSGVERVAQPVPEQVEGEDGAEDRESGPEHEVRDGVEVHRVREHAAPRGRGSPDTHAEERQGGLEQDVR